MVHVRAASGPAVAGGVDSAGHSATHDAAGNSPFGDELGHERTEAARHRMRLDGDHEREPREFGGKIIERRWFDARNDDDPDGDPAVRQSIV